MLDLPRNKAMMLRGCCNYWWLRSAMLIAEAAVVNISLKETVEMTEKMRLIDCRSYAANWLFCFLTVFAISDCSLPHSLSDSVCCFFPSVLQTSHFCFWEREHEVQTRSEERYVYRQTVFLCHKDVIMIYNSRLDKLKSHLHRILLD